MPGSEPWTLGEWTVVPTANELRHASGRVVRLEARTMEVLSLLRVRAGSVVPVEEVLRSVWADTAVTAHSVAVVISDLRKALEDDAKAPRFIQTVPKRGYRMLTPTRAQGTGGPARAASLGLLVLLLALALPGRTALRGATARPLDPVLQARYFQACQLWSRREHEPTLQALALFQQIVARRPDFAPAHAALADVYAHKTGEDLGLPALDTFRAAQRHLDRALALDPSDSGAYVTQALLDFYRDYQPVKALGSLDTALRLEPQSALAWQTRGMVLSAVGDDRGSLAAIERARTLDPVSESIGWDRVWFLYLARDYDKALGALGQASERSRRNRFYEALIEEGRGERRRALDLWLARFEQKGVRLRDPAAIRRLADRGALAGAHRELLRQLALDAEYHESSGVLAILQVLADEEDAALATLSAATPSRENWLTLWLHRLPVLDDLRTRAEMRAILDRIGMPAAARPIQGQAVAAGGR